MLQRTRKKGKCCPHFVKFQFIFKWFNFFFLFLFSAEFVYKFRSFVCSFVRSCVDFLIIKGDLILEFLYSFVWFWFYAANEWVSEWTTKWISVVGCRVLPLLMMHRKEAQKTKCFILKNFIFLISLKQKRPSVFVWLLK